MDTTEFLDLLPDRISQIRTALRENAGRQSALQVEAERLEAELTLAAELQVFSRRRASQRISVAKRNYTTRLTADQNLEIRESAETNKEIASRMHRTVETIRRVRREVAYGPVAVGRR